MSSFRVAIGPYLIPRVREALEKIPVEALDRASELRLRAGKKAALCCPAPLLLDTPPLSPEELRQMADAMLGHAAHARQEELRQGFVTLEGGCRAGLCGRAAVKDGKLQAVQDIASISIRIAREVFGAADPLLSWILSLNYPVSTLIASPPGFGKTTLLRDAARLLSERGLAVAIVDERSELAACVRGVPTLDVGPNTDVLDGCPKAEGIRLMLRAMAPRVIVTDELGRGEDITAVREAARCGVAVLASAHGRDFQGLFERPMLKVLLSSRVFERIVILSAVGSVGAVYDAEGVRLA